MCGLARAVQGNSTPNKELHVSKTNQYQGRHLEELREVYIERQRSWKNHMPM